MLNRLSILQVATLFTALWFSPLPVQAVSYGTNLLVNGNAEAGLASSTGAPVSVPGWTTTTANDVGLCPTLKLPEKLFLFAIACQNRVCAKSVGRLPRR
jgi:hypothetical protein